MIAQTDDLDAMIADARKGAFETPLSSADETKFQTWKAKYAPNDSGEDYDLRGAFKAGLQPDPETGHWPDTFKKPNHPTFSDESQYAAAGNPGHWNGETFVPGKENPKQIADSAGHPAIGSGDDIDALIAQARGKPISITDRPWNLRTLDLGDTLKGIGQGALHTGQSMIAGIPGTIEAIQHAAETVQAGEFADSASTGYGTNAQGDLGEALQPAPLPPPANDSESTGRLLGSVVPWAIGTALVPGAAIPLAATTTMADKFHELTAQGIPANQALGISAAHGLTDAATFTVLPIWAKVKFGQPVIDELFHAAMTGNTFAAAQIAKNEIDQHTTDPELHALTGAGGALGQGLLLHGVMKLVETAVASIPKNNVRDLTGGLPTNDTNLTGETKSNVAEGSPGTASEPTPSVAPVEPGPASVGPDQAQATAVNGGGAAPGAVEGAADVGGAGIVGNDRGSAEPGPSGNVAADAGSAGVTEPTRQDAPPEPDPTRIPNEGESTPSVEPVKGARELTVGQRTLMRDTKTVGPDDPRFETATEKFGVNPKFSREVTQNDLSEILPTGTKAVYHETNLAGADAILGRTERVAGGRTLNVDVSDNPDLALGQGGKGVLLEFDPKRVNGGPNRTKPGLEFTKSQGMGSEYTLDQFANGPVTALTIKSRATFEAARKRFGSKFDFDNPTETERGLRVERFDRKAELRARIDENLSKLAKGTSAGQNLDPAKLSTVVQLAKDHIELGAREFADWSREMIEKGGEAIRPYLRTAWDAAGGRSPEDTAIEAGESGFDLPKPNDFRRIVIDQFDRLKQAEAATPNPAGLTESVTTMPGKIPGRIEELRGKIEKPLVETLKRSGIDVDESKPGIPSAGDYLYALASKRANALLAAENDGRPGLSGISDEDAAKIIAEAKASGKQPAYDRIQALNRQLNEQRLGEYERSGLLSAEQAQALRDRWGADYVPFRSAFDPTRQMEGTSKGFTVSGAEFKKRGGRESKAENPLVMSLGSAESAIRRGAKNDVGNHLAQLVEQNPSPLWRVTDNTAGLKDGEQRLSFKENGEQKYVVTRDPKLIDAFRALDAQDPGILRALDPALKFLHNVFLGWNPSFPVSLASWHTLSAGLKGTIREGPSFGARVVADSPTAARAAWRVRANEASTGPWEELYKRGRDAGAFTGWAESIDFKERLDRFQKEVKEGPLKAKALAYSRFMDAAIRAVDVGPRLATFKAALDAGKSDVQAAMMARKTPVDFGQKGSMMPWFGRLYMFANAPIQDVTDVASISRLNPQRAAKVVGSLVAAGYIQAMVSRQLGGKDENGRDHWDALGEYDKARTWGLDIDGHFYGVRSPYVFNLPTFLGVQIEAMQHGKPMLDSVKDLFGAAIESGSPIKGANIGQALTPTLLKPEMEIAQNENAFGTPIHPTNEGHPPKPESYNVRKNVNPIAASVAQGVNSLTGGTPTRPGMIDVNPHNLVHLIEGYTGSAGKAAKEAIDTFKGIIQHKDVRLADIPIVNALVHQESQGATANLFYKNMDEVAIEHKAVNSGESGNRALAVLHEGSKGNPSVASTALKAVKEARDAGDEVAMRARMVEFNRLVATIKSPQPVTVQK